MLTAVWATALPVPFLLDDFADVVDNPAAKAESFLDRLGLTLRALLKASYALQDWLHGAWASGFHLANILLHIASAMVALALLRKLCRQAGLGEGAAIAATALWALHPALTASVTLVAGRSAVLSGLLLLGSFALSIGPPTNGRRLAAGLLAFLAPLARETALVLPLLLIWWQVTLGQKEGAALHRALPVFLGSLAAAAIILAMPRHRELIEFSLEARPPLDALRGNIQALPAILRFLFLPWDITIDPAQPLPHGWGEGWVLLPLTGLVVLLLAALFLRHRHPLWAFAIGWTFLCLLPSNSLLWRDEPVGLRPLYLSGLGPALLFGLVLVRCRLGKLLAVFLASALATLTVDYNRLCADPVALWQDASEKAPGKARPLIELGIALMDEGCLDQAQAALKKGLARQPGNLAAARAMERLTLLYQVNPPLVCDRS